MEKNTNTLPQINDITLVGKACREIQGFEKMYRRFERRMYIQKRSESTMNVLQAEAVGDLRAELWTSVYSQN